MKSTGFPTARISGTPPAPAGVRKSLGFSGFRWSLLRAACLALRREQGEQVFDQRLCCCFDVVTGIQVDKSRLPPQKRLDHGTDRLGIDVGPDVPGLYSGLNFSLPARPRILIQFRDRALERRVELRFCEKHVERSMPPPPEALDVPPE